jgi:hypothetical protein
MIFYCLFLLLVFIWYVSFLHLVFLAWLLGFLICVLTTVKNFTFVSVLFQNDDLTNQTKVKPQEVVLRLRPGDF